MTLNHAKLVFLDLETHGLSPAMGDRISPAAQANARQLASSGPPAQGDLGQPEVRGSLVQRHEPLVIH